MNEQYDFQGALKSGLTPEEITAYLDRVGRGKEAKNYFGIKDTSKKEGFFSRLGRVTKGIVEDIPSDIRQTVQGVKSAAGDALKGMREAQNASIEGEQSLGEGLLQSFGAGAKGLSRGLGEVVMGAARLPFNQQTEDVVSEGVASTVKPIIESSPIQNVIAGYEQLKKENPRLADNIDAALSIGELATWATGLGAARKVGGEAANAAFRATEAVATKVDDVIEGVAGVAGRVTDTVGERLPNTNRIVAAARKNATPQMVEQEVQGLKDTWTQFFNDNKSLKNKLLKEESFERDPAEVLARGGYMPEIENGRFNADDILQDIGNDIEESVDAIDTYVAKVPDTVSLNEMRQRAKQFVQNSERIKTTGLTERTLNEIDRKFDDLIAANGDNVSLTTVNNIRKNANRTTTAFDSDVYEADVADIVGRVSRDVIDEVTGDDAVRLLNADIAERISAAKMVKAFNGGAVRFGRFSQWAARLIGAVVGSDTGIPVIGPLLGALGGDAVIDLLQKQAFGGAVRKRILETLTEDKALLERVRQKASDIDAFDEALKRELQKPERQLPAPQSNSVGGGETIQLPSKTESTIELRERNNPNIKNPLLDAKNIHPDDQQVMTDFIDSARIGKQITNDQFDGAARLAAKFGISMDKGIARVAREFEKILLGDKKVKGTAVPGSIKKR